MAKSKRYKVLDVRELSDRYILIVKEEKTNTRKRLIFIKNRINKNTETVSLVIAGDSILYKTDPAEVGCSQYLRISTYKR